jgi:type III secretory pathway component EscV
MYKVNTGAAQCSKRNGLRQSTLPVALGSCLPRAIEQATSATHVDQEHVDKAQSKCRWVFFFDLGTPQPHLNLKHHKAIASSVYKSPSTTNKAKKKLPHHPNLTRPDSEHAS